MYIETGHLLLGFCLLLISFLIEALVLYFIIKRAIINGLLNLNVEREFKKRKEQEHERKSQEYWARQKEIQHNDSSHVE